MVSVLIVNYRAYDELTACLSSLTDDIRSGEVEAIVVDNAVTQPQFDAVRAQFSHVLFLANQDNRGFAAAVNQAAALAHGRHLLLLNPDAIIVAGAVQILARFLEDRGDVAVAGARVLDPDGTLQASARSFPGPLTGLFGRTSLLTRLWPHNAMTRRNLVAKESGTTPINVDWVAGSCMLIRADVFRAIGGMDARFFLYWEDADFCRRARTAGWKTAYVPSAQAIHQVGRSSRYASTRSVVAFHRSAFRYYRKHGPAAVAPLAALALSVRALAKITAGWINARTVAGP